MLVNGWYRIFETHCHKLLILIHSRSPRRGRRAHWHPRHHPSCQPSLLPLFLHSKPAHNFLMLRLKLRFHCCHLSFFGVCSLLPHFFLHFLCFLTLDSDGTFGPSRTIFICLAKEAPESMHFECFWNRVLDAGGLMGHREELSRMGTRCWR